MTGLTHKNISKALFRVEQFDAAVDYLTFHHMASLRDQVTIVMPLTHSDGSKYFRATFIDYSETAVNNAFVAGGHISYVHTTRKGTEVEYVWTIDSVRQS